MVKRLMIFPNLASQLAVAMTATADPTGQTVTPSNYVGYPPAGTQAMTYLRIGKPQVVTSQEYVLVDLATRPWPVLQRAVNGSPLAAHDTTHRVESIVVPDSFLGIVGVLQDGTLILNTDQLDFRGATVTDEGGVAVIRTSGGGGSAGSSGGSFGASVGSFPLAARVPVPRRHRAAASLIFAASVNPL